MTIGSLVSNMFTSTLHYTALPVEASPIVQEETIEERIDRIALEYKISTTSLANLVDCESKGDPLADNGKDRGLVQINRKHWPDITDAQAFDPEFSLRFAAEKIANGEGYMWTCGNCYSLATVLLGKLPRMSEIIPNSIGPRVNGLVIMSYKGVKHIAVITKVVEEGIWVREAHYEPYKISSRLISFSDSSLVGYYSLGES